MTSDASSSRLWLARLLIGAVLLMNVQCAALFLWHPADFTQGFEVGGATGEGIVWALGVLFLMWNVPYAVAMLHPLRYRVSLYEALVMQGIGLVGESLLLWRLPEGHLVLQGTVTRFILFDAAGLAALALAAWMILLARRKNLLI